MASHSLARCYMFWRAKPRTWYLKTTAWWFYQTRSQLCHPLVPPASQPHVSKGSSVTLGFQKEVSKEKGASRCQGSSPWTQFTLLYFLSSFQRKGTFNTPHLHSYSPYAPTSGSRPPGMLCHTSQFCSEGLEQEAPPFQMRNQTNEAYI